MTVTLKQGADGYTGTLNQHIYNNLPNNGLSDDYGEGTFYLFDNGSIAKSYGMLSFDVSSIPFGAIVESAALTVAFRTYYSPASINIYDIKSYGDNGMWKEGYYYTPPYDIATWNQRASGKYWTTDGSSVMDSVGAGRTFSIGSGAAPIPQQVDVTTDVQSMIDGTGNQGWLLEPVADGTGSSPIIMYLKNYPDEAYRPQLTITYHIDPTITQPPTPSPTLTPTFTIAPLATPTAGITAIPSPNVTIVPFATPELPRVFLDTTYSLPAGGTKISVPEGGDLQAALDQAQPGDIVELQAGATFTGHYTLPNKTGNDWIYIQSSAYSSLPAPGIRVSPQDAENMPKIVSPDADYALVTAPNAHNYRLVGIEVTTLFTDRTYVNYGIVRLDSSSMSNPDISVVPTDITIDRCYIHGTLQGGVKRGILMNSARTAIIESYISDCHAWGFDSQGIGSYNGPGPFKIVNNYIEGAAENIMFGGADARAPELQPCDIEVRRNYMYKPDSWNPSKPDYCGTPWTVKNLFELKNAQRVLLDGNVFDNCWEAGQDGTALMLTVRNQSGTNPWASVNDVTITNNIIRNSASGISISGMDDNNPSQRCKNYLIENNVFEKLIYRMLGMGMPLNVIVNHNTAIHANPGGYGLILTVDGPQPITGFAFTNNIGTKQTYGIFGSGYGEGNPSINHFYPDGIVKYNALIGADYSSYPTSNYFPVSVNNVGFVDYINSNYKLSDSSSYKNLGSDGKDLGADIDAVKEATNGVVIPPIPQTPPPSTPVPTMPPTPGPDTVITLDFSNSNNGSGINQYEFSNGTPGTLYGVSTTNWKVLGLDNHIFTDRGSADAYVAYKFYGTKIELFGDINNWSGIAACSILDENNNIEVAEQNVDCYNPTDADPNSQSIYTSPELPLGVHTLKVRVTTEANPSNLYINDGNNPPKDPYWSVALRIVKIYWDANVTPTPTTATPTPAPTTPTPVPTASPTPVPTASQGSISIGIIGQAIAAPANTTVQVYDGATLVSQGSVSTAGTTASVTVDNIHAGTYTVKVLRPNSMTRTFTGVMVESGQTTDLGTSIKLFVGDVNDDLSIDILDVTYIRGFTRYKKPCIANAIGDVNGDAVIDILDVTVVRSFSNYKKTAAAYTQLPLGQ